MKLPILCTPRWLRCSLRCTPPQRALRPDFRDPCVQEENRDLHTRYSLERCDTLDYPARD